MQLIGADELCIQHLLFSPQQCIWLNQIWGNCTFSHFNKFATAYAYISAHNQQQNQLGLPSLRGR